MADWHPVQTVQPIEFVFPKPGTAEPFAIIRWVNVTLDGEPVSRWRTVTWHDDPKRRRLLGAGYYRELGDAALDCHRASMAAMVRPALNETRR